MYFFCWKIKLSPSTMRAAQSLVYGTYLSYFLTVPPSLPPQFSYLRPTTRMAEFTRLLRFMFFIFMGGTSGGCFFVVNKTSDAGDAWFRFADFILYIIRWFPGSRTRISYCFVARCRAACRVFSEVSFWNSVEYGILYGIDFISCNSA